MVNPNFNTRNLYYFLSGGQ